MHKNQFLSNYIELKIFFLVIGYAEFLGGSSDAFCWIHLVTILSKSTNYKKKPSSAPGIGPFLTIFSKVEHTKTIFLL